MEVTPACPRCGSANTKFCYYNNYSLTQPRYFCKGCRRYWTKGGSLRNVPVGGGCRKSRRGRPVRMDRNPARDWAGKPGPILAQPEASTSNCNIDIAAVYANFLNQTPSPQIEAVSEGIAIPPIEFSHFPVGSLQPANGFFECGPEAQMFGPGSGVSMFQNSFMSVNPIRGNDLLPPLPGEMWPDSGVILPDQILDSGRAEVEPGEQNAGVVDGNMGPFGGLNLEAFFRS